MNMCACVEFSETLQRQPVVSWMLCSDYRVCSICHFLSPLQLVIDMLCSSESMSAERVLVKAGPS